LELLGAIGGLIEIFIRFFHYLINPIAVHSFIMKTISSLYIIKYSGKQKLFESSESGENKKSKYRLLK
jgi:hypothetical protein